MVTISCLSISSQYFSSGGKIHYAQEKFKKLETRAGLVINSGWGGMRFCLGKANTFPQQNWLFPGKVDAWNKGAVTGLVIGSSGWETYISCPSISSSLSGNMRIYTFLKFILPRKILFLKQGWCCGGAGDRQRWIGTIHLNIIPAVREYQDMHHPEINEIYHSKENFMLETMVVLRLGYR